MLRQLTQRAGFAVMAARPVRPVPVQLEPTGSLTCVVRLPEPLAARVLETVRRWPDADAHHVYPAGSLHLTVLNLTEIDGEDDALVRVKDIVSATPPLALRLQGFDASSHSVYLRVLDRTGGLVALRRRLLSVTGARPPWHLRRLAFVNVLRYRAVATGGLLPAVRSTAPLTEELLVERVELVRTDRLFSPEGTTVLDALHLRRSR